MSAPVFMLQQVGLRLGAVQALQDLTLHIHAGERVALVGSNGCGKSSLLRLLHGLLPPSAGQFSHAPALRQAMLFQRPHMLRCSAQNHVALGLWLAGMPWALARAQALAALHRVGLAPQAARSAKALSGGQQQRLALARAWALQPDVWLLDEPSASLDPHAKHAVEALMADFTAAPGPHGAAPTLIFSSHNLGQVKRLASRVLYLEQGRLLADLPVAVFFDGPSLHAVSPAAYLFVKGELG